MKDGEEEKRWVLCPWCGSKTRLQILWETELVTFPLFCPKCRHESIINAKNMDGFVKLTGLKIGGRTSVKACCCDACRTIIIQY